MKKPERMQEAAEKHGRPAMPVCGLYYRMENRDHKTPFKNQMRLRLLGEVAWLEFPIRKPPTQFVLPLHAEGEDAIRIDWSSAFQEWGSGLLQLVVEEGVRGLREKEEVFWKLEREYSEEEVKEHLEAMTTARRLGSIDPVLMDEELTDDDGAVTSSTPKRRKMPIASTPTAARSSQESIEETMLEKVQYVLYINLSRRTQRQTEILQELRNLRIPEDKIIRIDAVDAKKTMEKPIVSCCRSHIRALQCAMSNGWDEVLILEDDFQLRDSAERTKACWTHFREMVPTYQIASWAHNCLRARRGTQRIQILSDGDAGVVQVYYLQTASAYAVRRSAMGQLKKIYEDAIAQDRPFDTYMTRITHAVDWFAFDPALSIQRPSYSDILKKNVRYNC